MRGRIFWKGILLIMCLLLSTAISVRPSGALDTQEVEFLRLINAHRAELGLPELKLSPKLTRSAEWMSQDMANKGYFSHTDSKGRDPFERMADFGYSYNTPKGENLALGFDSAEAVFRAWMNSSGHRANMERSYFRAIGIGRAYSSTYGWFWTTDFGGLRDTIATATLSGHSDRVDGWYVYAPEHSVVVSGRVIGNYAGWQVTLYVQRRSYENGRVVWRSYKSAQVTLSSSSNYRRSFSLPVGSYRIRAVFPGNGRDVLRAVSPYHYALVR